MKEFYETYLIKCLEDSILTDKEVKNLTHLRQLLALEEVELVELHNRLNEQTYKNDYNKSYKRLS